MTLVVGEESQFRKYPRGEADYLGELYDLDSVMQYPRYAFGKIDTNGKRKTTIIARKQGYRDIGLRQDMSPIDVRQINKLYKCKKFLK